MEHVSDSAAGRPWPAPRRFWVPCAVVAGLVALVAGAVSGEPTDGRPPLTRPGVVPAKAEAPAAPPMVPLTVPGPGATVPLLTGQRPGAPGAAPTPFGGPLANPLLSPPPPGFSRLKPPSPATQEKLNKYVATLTDPETTLDLVVGQTRVLGLKATPVRVQGGGDNALAFNVVPPREVLLEGRAVGSSVLNIWFGDPNDPAKQEVLTYLVRVYPDPEAKLRLERAYQALADDINAHFKDCSVSIRLLGDKVVVSGRVRDAVQGGQVLQIVRANTQGGQGNQGAQGGGVAGTVPAGGDAAALDAFQNAGGPNVLNLLEVAGEQQVTLRVVVAEVNRAAARSVGLNFSVQTNQGLTVFRDLTGPVTGLGATSFGLGGTGLGGALSGGGGAAANLPFTVNAGRLPFALNALKTFSYARSLAEPNLATMNGQTANFQAGGQFPVPVVSAQNGFANGLQGVSFVPFGVQLSFTPFITDRDRIRLNLSASFSTRDPSAGANIGGANIAGLNSRNVNTVVELRQGETLAVAGLISSDLGADATKVPFIGDIPGIGPLTGLHRTSAGERELVIFVTPELTRPLDPGTALPLPGSEILDPTDIEFYFSGRIEGHLRDYRSPIRTDLSRIKMFHKIEAANVSGPVGYTPLP